MVHGRRSRRSTLALLVLTGVACAVSPSHPSAPSAEPSVRDARGLSPTAGSVSLAYHVSAVNETLTVEVEIQGPPRSPLLLGVVGDYGALTELDLIDELRAHDRRGVPVALAGIDSHTWEPVLPADGWLRVTYRVEIPDSSLDQPGSGELPALDEHHVFIPGFLTLVAPRTAAVVQGPIPVTWTLPAAWSSVTPFGARAPTLDSLLDNYLVAGRPSRDVLEIDGGLQIDLAWFGSQSATDSLLSTMLDRSFEAAVELVGGAAPTSRYLVIIRADAPAGTFEGSPKAESIQLHVPAGLGPDAVAAMRSEGFPLLARIVIHEYLHNWGRDRVPVPPSAEGPERGGAMRWYYEGFVDYLAHRALLGAGLVDHRTFIAGMAEYFEQLQANPEYGRRSLADASEAFFTSTSARRFAYTGGTIVAMLCDVELQSQGRGGLERFMAKVPPAGQLDSVEAWVGRWQHHAGSREPVERWVTGTEPLPFERYAQDLEALIAARVPDRTSASEARQASDEDHRP